MTEILCRNWIFGVEQFDNIAFFESNLVGAASNVLLPSNENLSVHLDERGD
jgi:hypothetical protein